MGLNKMLNKFFKDVPKAKKAASMVSLGLVAYFSIRYYNTAMEFPVPINLIVLVIAVLILWAATYKALSFEK